MRTRIPLNDYWQFTEIWTDEFGHFSPEASSLVKEVRLPHTCRETPFHYFDESLYQMVCGYRRVLHAPAEWTGKRVFLTFEAAGHHAQVFCNGEMLAEHRCGYTAFTVELTKALLPEKDNLLSVRLDSRESLNQPPFGHVIDYMTYGGLYREAYLEVKEETSLQDVFVKPNYLPDGTGPDKDEARIGIVGTEVRLHDSPDLIPASELVLTQTVLSYEGGETPLASHTFRLSEQSTITRTLMDGSYTAFLTEFTLPDIELWALEKPVLYRLRTELFKEEQPKEKGDGFAAAAMEPSAALRLLDETEEVFAFRKAEFKADGFYLNGEKTKIVGLNRHQSWPYVGYAMPASQQALDADILKKEMGVNAVRTSHYPQSHAFVRRCDELGLLVFTEIPGWQHIGDGAWKNQALHNTEDMVLQYRNHPSIILWGVRINESQDDDPFYVRTNEIARRLDPTRPTGGVRCFTKSRLLEDVYTYNDFIYDGTGHGCSKKAAVTSDMSKPYLVSEYNGHMYPTKAFDSEQHRAEHVLRHARVLNDIAGEGDIAGSFAWCFFDYNTHQDFGSGDRICYHGVTDMFRNPKPAASVYAVRNEEKVVLEVTSAMDIGEHPTGNLGQIYIVTNADEVKMYKNGRFIRSYTSADSEYKNLKHGPIPITDYIGDELEQKEGFPPKQAELVKDILNHAARFGFTHLPPQVMAKAGWLMARYGMKYEEAYDLYTKYIGTWGGEATVYRFDALKNGEVVKSVVKTPVKRLSLHMKVNETVWDEGSGRDLSRMPVHLKEGDTYDVAQVRICVTDQNGNVLPFYQDSLTMEVHGPLEIIGPKSVPMRGGMGGTYVKTTGQTGPGYLTVSGPQTGTVAVSFVVE